MSQREPVPDQSALPRGTSIVAGASFVPCCDLCGWIGKDAWNEGDARAAVTAHARGQTHRQNDPPPVGGMARVEVCAAGSCEFCGCTFRRPSDVLRHKCAAMQQALDDFKAERAASDEERRP